MSLLTRWSPEKCDITRVRRLMLLPTYSGTSLSP
jgi:hypothetical protein